MILAERTSTKPRCGLASAALLAVLVGCGSGPTKGTGGTSAASTGSAGTGGASTSAASSGGAGTGGSVADAGTSDGSGGDSGIEGAGGSATGPTTPASITVQRATSLATIGPGFAGLSYEKAHVDIGFFTPSNTNLIGLFKRLGPSVLRIGGITCDQTTWSATGTGNTAGVVSPPDVTALAGFLAATGWTVIYGVNLAADQPSAGAAEAAYAAGALGQSLYGFEIGNEPDFYAQNGDRATSYTYADFLAQWKTFYAAMHASAPKALFTGPASGGNYTTYTEPFAQDAAADIVLLTQHYYRGNGMSASSTLAELLSPDPSLITELQALTKATANNHLARGWRMAETNSFYNGGANGVSDAYGTALWVIDFLFTHAQYGAAGLNLHGGGNTPGYTPIADLNSQVVEARPEYYGMLLFTLAGQGEMFATNVTVAQINFTAYAVGPSDGSTNVVLVNKDSTQTVRATVDVGKTATTGKTTLLTGPSLASTTGFTLGGASVGIDGTWTPVASPPIPVTGTTLVVDVPPASAMLVHVD